MPSSCQFGLPSPLFADAHPLRQPRPQFPHHLLDAGHTAAARRGGGLCNQGKLPWRMPCCWHAHVAGMPWHVAACHVAACHGKPTYVPPHHYDETPAPCCFQPTRLPTALILLVRSWTSDLRCRLLTLGREPPQRETSMPPSTLQPRCRCVSPQLVAMTPFVVLCCCIMHPCLFGRHGMLVCGHPWHGGSHTVTTQASA